MNTTNISRFVVQAVLLLGANQASLFAQPYVDPIQVRYTYGLRNSQSSATPFSHLWVGSDVPVKLGEKSYLLISPFFDQWQFDSSATQDVFPSVKSLALPLGAIFPLNNQHWALTVLPIFRSNGEKLLDDETFQFGAISFATYTRKPMQKFRMGVYANSDFFGWFVVPLFGADWRIDPKNYVFGILPGRLTWEHKVNNVLYYGATFRAITNSYRLADGRFLRIDDNQVSGYLDFYPAKKIALTLEPGYGVFRKLRTGINDKNYLEQKNWGDGLFIKLSAAYRIRF